jgi:hypothetical protein
VVGVEEEERKKRRGRSRVLSLTWIFSQSPSVVDLVDLRAARVEPNHRSSACGRALDLAGAPFVDLRRTSTEPPLVGRSAAEATRRWRVHPTVSAQTGASGALSPAPLGRSESPLRRARGSGENQNEG